MKIFVTVGTTSFDSLIQSIDENFDKSKYDITLQTANGTYIPKNYESFNFEENIEPYYEKSDLVITHAGAGSIYRLLEMEKKIIIVPNRERVDKHQTEIANFMDANNYAVICHNYNDLPALVNSIQKLKLRKFKKDKFVGHLFIKELIEKSI